MTLSVLYGKFVVVLDVVEGVGVVVTGVSILPALKLELIMGLLKFGSLPVFVKFRSAAGTDEAVEVVFGEGGVEIVVVALSSKLGDLVVELSDKSDNVNLLELVGFSTVWDNDFKFILVVVLILISSGIISRSSQCSIICFVACEVCIVIETWPLNVKFSEPFSSKYG